MHRLYKDTSTLASVYSRNHPWKLLGVNSWAETWLLYFLFWRCRVSCCFRSCFYSSAKTLIPCCLAGFLICSQHMGLSAPVPPRTARQVHRITQNKRLFFGIKELEKDPLQNLALEIRFQSLNPDGTGPDTDSVWWVSESLSFWVFSSPGYFGVLCDRFPELLNVKSGNRRFYVTLSVTQISDSAMLTVSVREIIVLPFLLPSKVEESLDKVEESY